MTETRSKWELWLVTLAPLIACTRRQRDNPPRPHARTPPPPRLRVRSKGQRASHFAVKAGRSFTFVRVHVISPNKAISVGRFIDIIFHLHQIAASQCWGEGNIHVRVEAAQSMSSSLSLHSFALSQPFSAAATAATTTVAIAIPRRTSLSLVSCHQLLGAQS